MIWFDYVVLGFIFYFVIRGFLSGFISGFFSLVGMLVALLYGGWFSLKIKPLVASFVHHPKAQLLLSYFLSFLLIYLSFVLIGYVTVLTLKLVHLSLGDRILGALFGLIKGALFATFLFFLIIIPYPPAKSSLESALTYPIIDKTIKILKGFIPSSWIEFIQKSRKYYEIPKALLDS